ncbi:MAG: hypothetical protein ACKKMV_00750 [Candidatus Nealsonbacteria bacterium]
MQKNTNIIVIIGIDFLILTEDTKKCLDYGISPVNSKGRNERLSTLKRKQK